MKKTVTITILALMLVWGVGVKGASATYWAPTDSGLIDVNYVESSAGIFAIFDDSSNLSSSDNRLELDDTADTIYFIASGSDYALYRDTNDDGNGDLFTGMTLTNDSTFQIGWSSDNGATWNIDTNYTRLSSGVYNIDWVTSSGSASLAQIDATPSTVPIPAAIWLFGSGLLGLLGIRRQKNI